jgi:hypothetical protein
LVGNFPAGGANGTNIFSLDISGYSHGIYFYIVRVVGPSGPRASRPTKFSIIRSP